MKSMRLMRNSVRRGLFPQWKVCSESQKSILRSSKKFISNSRLFSTISIGNQKLKHQAKWRIYCVYFRCLFYTNRTQRGYLGQLVKTELKNKGFQVKTQLNNLILN